MINPPHPSQTARADHDRTTGGRRACVLLPLFSIRTSAGWGLGEIPDLVPFARWARKAGMGAVQLLPVHEVAQGESSPYAAVSAFALDPVYLSLDRCEDFAAAGGEAALSGQVRERLAQAQRSAVVDWEAIKAIKADALEQAFRSFVDKEWRSGSVRARTLERFRADRPWVDAYALYFTLAQRYGQSFATWPEGVRDRDPSSLDAVRADLEESILYRAWLEWQLQQQWDDARRDARQMGVELWGDLPFVVSMDAADVWERPTEFRRDLRLGVPPDAFSADGQDWGLPVFDWGAMNGTGFAWMKSRARREAELFDLYRVDHLVGLYRTFYRRNDGGPSGFLPPDEPSQVLQGENAIAILRSGGRVIAEDLGVVPDFVRASLGRLGVPGFRVLRWEKRDDGSFRDPTADWPELSVATTGTHDTETTAVWWDERDRSEREALLRLPGLGHLDAGAAFDVRIRDALLGLVYRATSDVLIVPFQDLFGARERINLPGTVGAHNWCYRTPVTVSELEGMHGDNERLHKLADSTGRLRDTP